MQSYGGFHERVVLHLLHVLLTRLANFQLMTFLRMRAISLHLTLIN